MPAEWGREDLRKYIEESDCVLMLGAFMTDINLGIFTARSEPGTYYCRDHRKV